MWPCCWCLIEQRLRDHDEIEEHFQGRRRVVGKGAEVMEKLLGYLYFAIPRPMPLSDENGVYPVEDQLALERSKFVDIGASFQPAGAAACATKRKVVRGTSNMGVTAVYTNRVSGDRAPMQPRCDQVVSDTVGNMEDGGIHNRFIVADVGRFCYSKQKMYDDTQSASDPLNVDRQELDRYNGVVGISPFIAQEQSASGGCSREVYAARYAMLVNRSGHRGQDHKVLVFDDDDGGDAVVSMNANPLPDPSIGGGHGALDKHLHVPWLSFECALRVGETLLVKGLRRLGIKLPSNVALHYAVCRVYTFECFWFGLCTMDVD